MSKRLTGSVEKRPERLKESEGQAPADEGFSSEEIHRAVFSRTPGRRSAEELKEGIAERMRRKFSRR